MMDVLVSKLDEKLSQHGMITSLLAKTETDVFHGEEHHEVEMYFAESEEAWDKPVATIHLFPLEDTACEVEVEIEYPQEEGRYEDAQALWAKARELVAEASLTEKRRYIEVGELVEASIVLDYHFVVQIPRTEEEDQQTDEMLSKFAADLGQLVRL
ncbi:hypothetical protein [Brevibacillus dissolubilis]|uniref:hypothetical protein n=1 Tax=Brevibacillus dissolubilis TaxID=1844116 RepID=UPI001116332D|nr:hypothetical protein [Brevibacillus dissolubilis]